MTNNLFIPKSTKIFPNALLSCSALVVLLASAPRGAQAQETVYQAPSDDSVAANANEPEKKKRRLIFGINAGAYVPTDSKTRSRFGSSGLSIGPGFGAVKRVGDKGTTSLSFSFISMDKGPNKFYMLPIGVSYIRPLGGEPGQRRAFYGVSLDAVPAKIKSLPDNVDSGIKLGYGGSAFVGTTMGKRAFAEGRYRLISDIEDFKLSGFELSLGYRF